MTNPDPHIPNQMTVTVNGVAYESVIVPVAKLTLLKRKAAALDWLMAEAMDERWLANDEARTEIQLVIPSRYPVRADGDYLETLERARVDNPPNPT